MLKYLVHLVELLAVFLLLGLTFSAMAWGSVPSGPYRELTACCIGFVISYGFLNVGTPKAQNQIGFIL